MTPQELAKKSRPLTEGIGRGTGALTIGVAGKTSPPRYCTGHYFQLRDGSWTVHHDGPTCPSHEVEPLPLVSELVLDEETRNRMGW